MRKLLALLAVCGALAGTGSAQASILTFNITGLSDFSDIPTTYGDNINALTVGNFSYGLGNGFTPNISVDYRTRTVGTGPGGTLFNHLDWWSNNYGDLQNVAYPVDPVSTGEISLVPQAGWAVRLNSFDLAGWPNLDFPNQPLIIFDENYNVLANLGPILVQGDFTGPRHTTVNVNLTHNGIIRIQFGDNWDVGIDNVNFDQVPAGVGVIPEPATLTLFGLGAAALGGYRLRRRVAV